MTQEHIKQEAIKYCDDMWGSDSITEQDAYIAGAESQQEQINQLTKLLKRVVWVWDAPIEERSKPYAEHMADVVLEIEEFLKLNI